MTSPRDNAKDNVSVEKPQYTAEKTEDFYAFIPQEQEHNDFAIAIHDAMEGFFGWVERVVGEEETKPEQEGQDKKDKENLPQKEESVIATEASDSKSSTQTRRPKRIAHVPRSIPVFLLEKVQQKIFALLEELDYERNQLAQLFIEFDSDFDWLLDNEELKKLLTTIHEMTDKEMGFALKTVNPDSDPLRPVRLVDLLEWWWQLSVSPRGKAAFPDLEKSIKRYFMIRSVKKVAHNLVGDPELFKKLSYLPEEKLSEMITRLDLVLYELRVWKAQKLAAEMLINERTALRYAVHAEWEEEEIKAIIYAWDKVVGSGVLKRSQLTEFCALLNYDMTAGTIRMTRKLYPEVFDLQTFLDWWACRPHVGKAAGSAMALKETFGIAGKSFALKRKNL
eukprot:TRINITY_DN2711_c0_g1_i2.p3 TRINITY_DN2711_c0_g1~~TRINITY_DN2711_c0_g1_i2.p3  ORF type:complete len:393 (+),score=91.98 TRINITY_DN2711_c0_g1_i2:1730-2908(+)